MVVDRDVAVVQDEAADRRNVPTLRTLRRFPVAAPVSLAHQLDGSVLDIDERKNPAPSKEEGQKAKFECQMTDVGGGNMSTALWQDEYYVCRGCGRTVAEVAHWVSMTAEQKEVVWQRILAQGYPRRNR